MGFNSEFKGLMYVIVNVLHNGDGKDDGDDDDLLGCNVAKCKIGAHFGTER
jgi:hypothetical protein